MANNIVAVEGKATNDQAQHQESQESVRFSPEQYKALLALIQQPCDKNSASTNPQVASISSCSNHDTTSIILSCEKANSTTSWILDSGATDHVSHSLTNFHSYHNINPSLLGYQMIKLSMQPTQARVHSLPKTQTVQKQIDNPPAVHNQPSLHSTPQHSYHPNYPQKPSLHR